MNLSVNLSDFNRRIADVLLPVFAADIQTYQSDDGTLLFRGVVGGADSQAEVGTHVAVSLDDEVWMALGKASPDDRERMIGTLSSNLAPQVEFQYDRKKISSEALCIVGGMNILDAE